MISKIVVITGENRVSTEEIVNKLKEHKIEANNTIAFPEAKPKWLHSLNLKSGMTERIKGLADTVGVATYSEVVLRVLIDYSTLNDIEFELYRINNNHSIDKLHSIAQLKGTVLI